MYDDGTDKDWRLKAELGSLGGPAEDIEAGHALNRLIGLLRGPIGAHEPPVVKDVEASVPHDVVITHDGKLLFAYAADEATVRAARAAIETVLHNDHATAVVYVSHWDEELDQWRQIEPPLSSSAQRSQDAEDRDARTIETRTLVASSGKLIRAEVEQTMLEWADRLGLECKLLEHPHLLKTQVAFTVTGPRRKVQEFAEGLKAEEWATIRAENQVMLSPL